MPKFRPSNGHSLLQAWRSHLLAALDYSQNALPLLHQILSQSITSGLWRLDPFASSRILSSLAAASLPFASLAFEHSHNPSPFAYNSLIRAHTSPPLILSLFRRMLRSGFRPDHFTFPFLLRSPSPSAAPAVHSLSLRCGLSHDPHVATSLLHSYGSSGQPPSARKVFDEMPNRTTVTWNAIVSCFAKHDSHREDGLHLFGEMLCSSCNDVRPNADTFIGVLSCCAGLGMLGHGQRAHALAMRHLGCLSTELGTSLIHMYNKCGKLESGRRVFETMESKDVAMWTAIIGGLAMHGCGEDAVGLFERMLEEERLMPDSLAFTSALHACSHLGLVEKGIRIFNDMKKYRVEVRMEHYGAMVDLFGRVGRLEEAEEIVKAMPLAPNRVVWGSLLHACIVHGKLGFGRLLERRLLGTGLNEEEGDGSGFYVGVSNVYANEGRWDEVGRVRDRMIEKGVKKEMGFSLVEVNGRFHRFLAGHSLTKDMYSLLCGINKEMSFV